MSLIQKAIDRHYSEHSKPYSQDPERPEGLDLSLVIGNISPISPISSNGIENPDHLAVEIDLKRLAHLGFAVPGTNLPQTIGEFRRAKRPLLLNVAASTVAEARKMRRIMIASALPEEGKTFCALNLALSLANEKDFSVLLVDADFPKPSIHHTLDIPMAAGIIDALQDPGVDVESLIQPTSIPNLAILGPGSSHPKATELLASRKMQDLAESLTLRDPNRIVIFDSPPLLVTTEAAELSRLMGQIVLVMSTGSTPRTAVTSAVELLSTSNAETSILLNRFPNGKRAGKYSYGYGKYGSTYGE